MSANKSNTAGATAQAAIPGMELAPSLRAHFKDIFTYIEEKQYKRSVKAADAILKAVPAHGESMAMKALALLNMGKKEEALELGKAALKSNVKSHICWHVYGMIQKQENNFLEAVKSFKNALKADPENQQILRDLALLQMQMRDYRGHHETRRAMLTSKSNLATNWIGLAVAHQLSGNCELALAVLEQYESTLDPAALATYETSEMQLYKIRVLEQSGNIERALHVLNSQDAAGRILDSLAVLEKRGQLLLALGRTEAAMSVFLDLMNVNPEHYGYHRGLQLSVLGRSEHMQFSGCQLPSNTQQDVGSLSAADVRSLTSIYLALHARYPSSRAVRRIPLEFLPVSSPLLQPLLGSYLRAGFRKGLPALFTDVKQLARSTTSLNLSWPARQAARIGSSPDGVVALLRRVIDDCLQALQNNEAMPVYSLDANKEFAALSGGAAGDFLTPAGNISPETILSFVSAPGDAAKVDSTAVLPWVWMFSAKLADEMGDSEIALQDINAALNHTPTIIDLHLAKARILKHQGLISAAAELVDYARSLDLADRFLNSKATKYLLRAGRVEQANKTIALFSRMDTRESSGDPLGNIKSLQVLWFELEKANAYERFGNIALAIKHYMRVDKHFKEFVEDQTDFHGYCLRKGPIRAYADVLATLDKMPGHVTFIKAMLGLARCFLVLSVDPNARLGSARWTTNEPAKLVQSGDAWLHPSIASAYKCHISIAESQVRNAAEAAASIAAVNAAKTSKAIDDDGAPVEKDEDLLGDRISNIPAPLEEAFRYITIAVSNLPAFKAGISTVAESQQLATSVKLPTPVVGGSVGRGTCNPSQKSHGWNVDADLIASCHALASDIALIRCKLLSSVAHIKCAQSAARASSSAYVGKILAAGTLHAPPIHFLHPDVLASSVLLFDAIGNELKSPTMPHPGPAVLAAFVNDAMQAPEGTSVLLTKIQAATTTLALSNSVLKSLLRVVLPNVRMLPLFFASTTPELRSDCIDVSTTKLWPYSGSPGATAQFVDILAYGAQHKLLEALDVEKLMLLLRTNFPACDDVLPPSLESPAPTSQRLS